MTSTRDQVANLKKAFAEHDIPWPLPKGTTLFWHQTGPLMHYRGGMLYVENLNPEVKTRWTMSRTEMLRLAWRCLVAALRR